MSLIQPAKTVRDIGMSMQPNTRATQPGRLDLIGCLLVNGSTLIYRKI